MTRVRERQRGISDIRDIANPELSQVTFFHARHRSRILHWQLRETANGHEQSPFIHFFKHRGPIISSREQAEAET